MKLFIDTADVAEIKRLNDLGIIDGVTTNPSLVLKVGKNFKDVVRDICQIVDGPISAEVVATDFDAMIREGDKTILRSKLLKPGDGVVIVSGRLALPSANYLIKVHWLGDQTLMNLKR